MYPEKAPHARSQDNKQVLENKFSLIIKNKYTNVYTLYNIKEKQITQTHIIFTRKFL